MSVVKIFSLLDVKANHFDKPFCDLNAASALRSFGTVVNSGEATPLAQYPDDFALCELADFDQATGKVTPLPNPLNLGSGRTVKREEA